MYNIIIRHISATTVAMEKLLVLYNMSCVCTLSHPACKVHVLNYTGIWGLSGSTVFFHLLS